MKIEETSWEEIAAASNGSSSLADYNLSGKTLIFDGKPIGNIENTKPANINGANAISFKLKPLK